MANTLKLNKKTTFAHKVVWEFLCTLSAGYTNGGAVGVAGETLNFNGASNPNYFSRPRIPSVMNGSLDALPATADIKVKNSPGGYSAVVERNAVAPTAANFVMRLFGGGSGNANPAELATAAGYLATYPGILNEPFIIQVEAPLRYN